MDQYEIERLRRSVVMLTPAHPSGLNREAALAVLEELQAAECRCRELEEGLRQAVGELVRAVRQLLGVQPTASTD